MSLGMHLCTWQSLLNHGGTSAKPAGIFKGMALEGSSEKWPQSLTIASCVRPWNKMELDMNSKLLSTVDSTPSPAVWIRSAPSLKWWSWVGYCQAPLLQQNSSLSCSFSLKRQLLLQCNNVETLSSRLNTSCQCFIDLNWWFSSAGDFSTQGHFW